MTYQPKHGEHEVLVARDPDVQERAHVRRDDARGDGEVVDLARGRYELSEVARAAPALRSEGALLELRAHEFCLEFARLVRVQRLRELPVVGRVECWLRVERGHPEHTRRAPRCMRVRDELVLYSAVLLRWNQQAHERKEEGSVRGRSDRRRYTAMRNLGYLYSARR